MPCRDEPRLEIKPENRLKSKFYYLVFRNHTFVTLSPGSFELFSSGSLVVFIRTRYETYVQIAIHPKRATVILITISTSLPGMAATKDGPV